MVGPAWGTELAEREAYEFGNEIAEVLDGDYSRGRAMMGEPGRPNPHRDNRYRSNSGSVENLKRTAPF